MKKLPLPRQVGPYIAMRIFWNAEVHLGRGTEPVHVKVVSSLLTMSFTLPPNMPLINIC